MKIALLTKYGNLAASTRQRFQQYRPFLAGNGFEIEVRPLLGDVYLTGLYAGHSRDRSYVARQYLNRMLWLCSAPNVDLIWLHCETFPYLPAIAELLVRCPGKPIVFDFDDAIFHNYDLHPNRGVRMILENKLQTTVGSAALALCGNAYLADYASRFCPQTKIVPTVVDLDVYRIGHQDKPCKDVLIGWIGTPSTWTEYMSPMLPLLADVAAQGGARIVAVGAGKAAAGHPMLDNLTWSEDTEVAHIQQMDIGVMPLTDTPWARGKCGYKLIQYMACGLPVVASPVGVNAEIVEHGVNGFLASSEAEWREALVTLLGDPALRKRMGLAGRRKVEEQYSLQVWGPRVAAMLRDVADRGHRR